MKKFILIILLIPLFSCSGDLYLNSNYQFEKVNNINLAIYPVGSKVNFSDSVFTKIFYDSTGFLNLKEINDFRNICSTNYNLVNIINKIVSKDYTEDELNSNPNLSKILTDEEFNLFKKIFYDIDIVLIPIIFDLNSSLGHTFGNTLFRLYDLKKGNLIYENKDNINVNLTDEYAYRYLTILLIAREATEFEKNYLNKVKPN